MSRNFELLQRAAKERQTEQARELQRDQAVITKLVVDTAIAGAPESRPAFTALDDSSRESIVKLVQRLFLLPGATKLVIYSAAEHGAGCTWLVTHSADALAAQVSGSICVVDANFRSPVLHERLAVPNHFGLTDSLCRPGPIRDFAQRVAGRSNLWLLSCGSLGARGAELLNSEAMRIRMAELRSEFDYVLVDSSPLNPYTDTIVLGQMADGVALVLEANSTRRENARQVAQDLAAANVRLLGAVLNKRTFPIPEKIYSRL